MVSLIFSRGEKSLFLNDDDGGGVNDDDDRDHDRGFQVSPPSAV